LNNHLDEKHNQLILHRPIQLVHN